MNAMVTVPVDSVAEVELIISLYGQRCENTLYFRQSGAWTAENMDLLAASMVAWYTANIAPLQNNNTSLVLVRVTDLSADGQGIEYAEGLPVNGTYAVGDGMPNNVTAAIKFSTALRGRSYRGRNYVVGLTSAQISANTLLSTTAVAYQAAYSLLMSLESGTLDPDWVVVSRYHDKAVRTAGVATTITHVSMNLDLDSQRRRLNGRGA